MNGGWSGFDEDLMARHVPPAGPVSRSAHPAARYDFGVAYPDPDSLPLEQLVECLAEELQRAGRTLAHYPHPLGYPPLREWLAARLAATRGFAVDADDILLGSGSNEPNFLVAQALVDPGDVVLAEEFTYAGTLGFLRRFEVDVRAVECDTDGMLPDSLEYQIQTAIDEGRRPKAVYTIPTFQNPLGFVESRARRAEVTEITARYGVPVWEDDCYVDLNFDHPDLPPAIRSLDDSGRTIYVASFSKNIAPGMRLGYVTAAPALLDRICAIKGTGGVSQFTAMAVHRFAQTGLDAHIELARNRLQAKRDALLAALAAHLGDRARWTRPLGGLFLFVQMLDGSDTVAAAERAAARGVRFAPGTHTAADGVSGRDRMRLCYGWNRPDEMAPAIAELAAALQPEPALARG
ncbi:MAG: PLP-dependent aminotransferase family protein [Spirochaetaceae bacterium]|nr:PLP-dependent aminotransferase family protein [Spirochaetaceae bacterium]